MEIETVIPNITVSIDSNLEDTIEGILKKYHYTLKDIKSYRVLKESIDARKKSDIKFIYSIAVKADNKSIKNLNKDFKVLLEEKKEPLKNGNIKLFKRPIVVGSGPAGLFSSLTLAKNGFRPILFEQGENVESRQKSICNYWMHNRFNGSSNIQFGEGGAGTFSDGKLTTGIKDQRCKAVLEEFYACGAPKEILYKAMPHIGSDNLIKVVGNLRKKIIEHGGEFFFDSKVTDFTIKNDKVISVLINNSIEVETDILILATGHSGRDMYELIYNKGFELNQKPFSIGLRIEHLQDDINYMQYGKFAKHPKLKGATYKLFHNFKDRTAYSFCMCPGGQVVAANSEENSIVTNGMSGFKRDKDNANSAIVVTVDTFDFVSKHPLSGIEFQRKFEKKAFEIAGSDYSAPVQRLSDYFKDNRTEKFSRIKPSYTGNTRFADLNRCLPNFINDKIKLGILEFNKKIKGFNNSDCILTGVETRTSAPVRILRNEKFEATKIRNIYPAGEGSGYAGGIMSSAVDGIKIAEAIIEKFDPRL